MDADGGFVSEEEHIQRMLARSEKAKRSILDGTGPTESYIDAAKNAGKVEGDHGDTTERILYVGRGMGLTRFGMIGVIGGKSMSGAILAAIEAEEEEVKKDAVTIPAGEGTWHKVDATVTATQKVPFSEKHGGTITNEQFAESVRIAHEAVNLPIVVPRPLYERIAREEAVARIPEKSDKGNLLWLRGDGSRS